MAKSKKNYKKAFDWVLNTLLYSEKNLRKKQQNRTTTVFKKRFKYS